MLPFPAVVQRYANASKPLCLRPFLDFGAGNEIRTRDPDLGKVVLYQLSYSRFQNNHKEIYQFLRFANSFQ